MTKKVQNRKEQNKKQLFYYYLQQSCLDNNYKIYLKKYLNLIIFNLMSFPIQMKNKTPNWPKNKIAKSLKPLLGKCSPETTTCGYIITSLIYNQPAADLTYMIVKQYSVESEISWHYFLTRFWRVNNITVAKHLQKRLVEWTVCILILEHESIHILIQYRLEFF